MAVTARRRSMARSGCLALAWFGVLILPGCGTSAERSATTDGAVASMSPGDTMHIHFERTGGFAGLTLTADIATDTLSRDDQSRLQQLVEDADFFALPAELRDVGTAVDQFVYRVTIEVAGQRHTVETPESAAAPELQALLEWLTRAARRRT